MEKCLVTKLNGSSDNSELLKVGEMRMKISKVESPTYVTQGFFILVSKPTTLEIIGEGYFTDSTLTENKGKTLVIDVNNNNTFWVSSNDVEIAILEKYSINKMNILFQGANSFGNNKSINIDDLKYSLGLTTLSLPMTQVSGDIANLKNLTGLVSLDLSSTQVSGDIANLKNLTALTYLSFNNVSQVSGDIANLKNLTGLTQLQLNNTKVSGDIANLKNLTALTHLYIESNAQVSGDVEVFSGMKNIVYISLKRCTLTGDLSKIPDNCKFICFQSNINTVLSWTNRPSTAYILALEGNAKITDVDKMLQDQAQCKVGYNSSSYIYEKTIACVGNRTSASDAAVATLQSKGYTVSITPA